MSYKFPDRYPRSSDVVEFDDINKHFGDIAEVLPGQVGEHNLQEGSSYNFDDATFYQVRQAGQGVIFNTTWTGSAPHGAPPEESAFVTTGGVVLDNSGVWNVIETIQYDTDNMEVVHALAHITYCWVGFATSGTIGVHNHAYTEDWFPKEGGIGATVASNQPWEPPKVQFALRINGALYSMTGYKNMHKKPNIAVKPREEMQALEASGGVLNASPWPGRISILAENVAGPAHKSMAAFLTDLVPVPSGQVTVELVARRLSALKSAKFAANDVVAIYNRQLCTISYPQVVSRNRAASPITFVPIGKGDAATQTQLNTNLAQRIKTKIDDLTAADFHKLNRYHLPPPVVSNGGTLHVGSVAHEYATPIIITNVSPYADLTTFAAVGSYTGNTAHTPLDDSGTELLAAPAGGFRVDLHKGWMIVTGTVWLESIRKTAATTATDNAAEDQQMAMVGIYAKIGSSRQLYVRSAVLVSRVSTPKAEDSVSYNMVTAAMDGQIKVPVMLVIEQSSLAGASIDGFGICVSTINWIDSASVDVRVAGMQLTAEYYKE